MIDSHRSLWIAKQNLQDYSCATAGRAFLEAIDAFLEENTSVTESDIKTIVSLVGESGYCLIKGQQSVNTIEINIVVSMRI